MNTAPLPALIALASALALTAPPALAQAGPPGPSDQSGSALQMPGIDLGGQDRHYTLEEKQRFQDIDSQYKKTIQKIPDKKASSDPWADMRQPSGSKGR